MGGGGGGSWRGLQKTEEGLEGGGGGAGGGYRKLRRAEGTIPKEEGG